MPIHFQPGGFRSPRSTRPPSEAGGALPLNAVIARRDDLADDLARLLVRPDGWELEPHEPGQYARLQLQVRSTQGESVPLSSLPGETPELASRDYSIASPPGENELEFLVNLVSHGRFTPSLWRMEPGDRVHLDPRLHGSFTLGPVPRGADLLLVATGTGIAPFLAMLRHYAGTGRWGRAVLLHGVRRPDHLAARRELEHLAEQHPDTAYLPTVTRDPEAEAWPGLRGRVQALLQPDRFREITGLRLDPAREERPTHAFLCGNPSMIRAVTAQLEALGFARRTPQRPEGTIHVESYW